MDSEDDELDVLPPEAIFPCPECEEDPIGCNSEACLTCADFLEENS